MKIQKNLISITIATLAVLIGSNSSQGACFYEAISNLHISSNQAFRLCRGATDSPQPLYCAYQAVAANGPALSYEGAISLCRGARSAEATIQCYDTATSTYRMNTNDAIEYCQAPGL